MIRTQADYDLDQLREKLILIWRDDNGFQKEKGETFAKQSARLKEEIKIRAILWQPQVSSYLHDGLGKDAIDNLVLKFWRCLPFSGEDTPLKKESLYPKN